MLTIYTNYYNELTLNKTVLETISFKYFAKKQEILVRDYNAKIILMNTMHIDNLKTLIHQAENAMKIREDNLNSVVDEKFYEKAVHLRRQTDAQIAEMDSKLAKANENHLNEIQTMMLEHGRERAMLRKQLELVQDENTTLKQSNTILANDNQLLGETNQKLHVQCERQSHVIIDLEQKAKTSAVTYDEIRQQLLPAQVTSNKLKDIKKKYETLQTQYKKKCGIT